MTQTNSNALSLDILSLPDIVYTKSGVAFDPAKDMWVVPDTSCVCYFNFARLRRFCSAVLIALLKKNLISCLKEQSVRRARNNFFYFKAMIEEVVDEGQLIDAIGWELILTYKSTLSEEHEHHLGQIRGFLKEWYKRGYPGVSREAYDLLDLLRLRGNRQGYAVLTMDPETGPFTETELQAIHVALNAAYAAGKITNRQAALAWLFIGIGPRPVQIADLKVKDVESKGSTGEFVVNIPRVKQRYLPKRSEFKKRPLLKDIAEIVAAWIEEVKLIGADRVPEIDAGELPMFPEWHQPNAPGFEHHSNGETLGSELSSIFDNLIVTSHRTKGPMSITPYRFRYTLGKRAAEEGYGDLVIADLLDHSGTGCVWIYVHFGPRTMKILNKALAKEFSWLGAAFGGKIVRNEGSTDRVSTIRAPGMAPQNAGVGRCGGCGDCTGMAPVACYVCPIFEAFVDGPHEEVLDYLLSDQERILAETGDERIAHANDHIILAVAKVLQLCNEINGAAQ